MRRQLVLLVAALSACNPARDERDEQLEGMLDRTIVEKKYNLSEQARLTVEHEAIRQRLLAFRAVTQADLEALAGTGETKREPKGFSEVVTLTRTGSKADALHFLRAALEFSPAVGATGLEVADDRWTASVALTLVPASSPRTKKPPASGGPSHDTWWCYSACRARQKRIDEKVLQLARLEHDLGDLNDLLRDKKKLEDVTHVREDFLSTPMTLATLDVLEAAPWFDRGSTVRFTSTEVVLRSPPGRVGTCVEALARLGTCAEGPDHSVHVKPAR